jgi:hypothetical protein
MAGTSLIRPTRAALCAWFGLCIVPCIVLAVPWAVFAQAPPAERPAEAGMAAARSAYETLPEEDRKALQDALVWTGDYAGVPDGSFGKQTYNALLSYQRAGRLAPDGILGGEARRDLAAAARRTRERAGFASVDDPRTRVRIGLPLRLLTKTDVNPSGGSRWQSADGRVTVDTRAIPAGDVTLQGLYERNLAIQAPGRRIAYKVIRPDFFVVSGETPSGKFYTRYAAGPDGLRGFSIGYEKSLSAEIDRVVVAISNSFVGFPERGPSAPPPTPTASSGDPSPSGKRLAGSGLVVGPRQVATTVPAGACPRLRVAAMVPVQIRAAEDGLTVLELPEALKNPAPRLRGGSPAEGTPVLVLAYATAEDRPGLAAVEGRLDPGGVTAALQEGGTGGVVLDRSGALLGLVGKAASTVRSVAGVAPPARYALVRLTGAGGAAPPEPAAAGPDRPAAAIAADAGAGVVPILCDVP